MTEKAFVAKLKKCFIKEGFLTKKEVGVGYGVADLVLINKKKIITKNLLLRNNQSQLFPLLKEEYFKVLNLLTDSPQKTSLDLLIRKSYLSKPFLKYNILKILENKGYIKSMANNYYFKINGWMPLTNELIAIEAKMNDWKRGLIQANRYKVFANKVYLAVPSTIQHRIDRKVFRRHGVGLISLNVEQNKKTVLVAAPNKKPTNKSKNNLAIEHFWCRNLLCA